MVDWTSYRRLPPASQFFVFGHSPNGKTTIHPIIISSSRQVAVGRHACRELKRHNWQSLEIILLPTWLPSDFSLNEEWNWCNTPESRNLVAVKLSILGRIGGYGLLFLLVNNPFVFIFLPCSQTHHVKYLKKSGTTEFTNKKLITEKNEKIIQKNDTKIKILDYWLNLAKIVVNKTKYWANKSTDLFLLTFYHKYATPMCFNWTIKRQLYPPMRQPYRTIWIAHPKSKIQERNTE